MLELTINTHTSLLVKDIDQEGHVEFQVYNDMFDENMYIYLNEDEIKQLIDHLNKQIS